MSYENMIFTCPHQYEIAECSDKGCAQINATPRVFGTNEFAYKIVNQEGTSRYQSNRLMRNCMNKVFQSGRVGITRSWFG